MLTFETSESQKKIIRQTNKKKLFIFPRRNIFDELEV